MERPLTGWTCGAPDILLHDVEFVDVSHGRDGPEGRPAEACITGTPFNAGGRNTDQVRWYVIK
jgi:hypothetical protein